MNTLSSAHLESPSLCRELLRKMLLVHYFEETALRLLRGGLVPGTLHPGIGEEATGVGTGAALKENDYIFVTHRGHGQAIGKGMDINAMMAELLGRATGTNRGKGGSMHIFDRDCGVLGANGILGANAPLACGAALSIQMQRIPDRIALCYFGDGSSNQGAVHEAMNLAAAWKLPLVFVLTNNTYGMSTPLERAVNDTDLTKRAIPFGIRAFSCDGNDVLAVYDTVLQARQYALTQGPALVVEQTYRTCGHSKSDRNLYRSQEEIDLWRGRCPIKRFRELLIAQGVFSSWELDALELEAAQCVAEAERYALSQPLPQPQDLEAGVYAP